jgi:hypothetical protein
LRFSQFFAISAAQVAAATPEVKGKGVREKQLFAEQMTGDLPQGRPSSIVSPPSALAVYGSFDQ